MKVILLTILLFIFVFGYSQKDGNYQIGEDYVILFQAKNKCQAKRITKRFKKACFERCYFESNGIYIELEEGDESEAFTRFGNMKLCIPLKLRKNIKIIEIVTIDQCIVL